MSKTLLLGIGVNFLPRDKSFLQFSSNTSIDKLYTETPFNLKKNPQVIVYVVLHNLFAGCFY